MVATTQAEVGRADEPMTGAPGQTAEGAAGRPRTGWRRRVQRARPYLWALAAVVVVAVATRAWVVTRDATARARDDLDDTSAQVERAQADLDAANGRLAAVRATLSGEDWTLDLRESEQATIQAQLDEMEAVLTDLEAALAVDFTDLAAGTTQLDALERCLIGVAGALNQVSVGDTAGVARTLGAIHDSCAQAGVVP